MFAVTHHRTETEFLGADPEDAIALRPILPSGVESRVAEVFAFRDTDKSLIFWTLTVRSPPDGPPPPSVQEMDTRLGGRDGLARLLSEMNDAATGHRMAISMVWHGSSQMLFGASTGW